MVGSQQPLVALTTLMHLEGMARDAQTLKGLQFLMVNETRSLISYCQAYVFKAGPNQSSRYQVEAASSVSVVERDAPLIRWLERAVRGFTAMREAEEPTRISETDCPDDLKGEWKEFSFAYVLWCPLRLADKSCVGGLWLAKEAPWEDNELILMRLLSKTYAHAWKALRGPRTVTFRERIPRPLLWAVLIGAGAALFLPVRLSTLAPAEIIAKDPTIVSAPMDGVIADILVPPNTLVLEGQTILVYEDTNLRNQYEVRDKNLAVALAEYHNAAQGAFVDPQSKAQVPLLKAEAELRETERDYARELLEQVDVKAAQPGLLLYTDESDWIGRPVVVGERIMEIADPKRVELRIDLPVDDAIVLRESMDIRLFLDARPLDALAATLTHASYHPEVLPGDVLAYRLTAQLDGSGTDVRIGWQGTAKIYGEDVTLFFLLFRRPISAVRQFLGL